MCACDDVRGYFRPWGEVGWEGKVTESYATIDTNNGLGIQAPLVYGYKIMYNP